MARTLAAETLAITVYAQLRTAILSARYEPGERLQPARLAQEYQVSAGIVREALTRLAEQGLTRLEPNRGHRVVTLTPRQITDLVELRRIVESAALRQSLTVGDTDWEADAVAAHYRLLAADRSDLEGRSGAHRDFHLALMGACKNERLLKLCAELFDASELYRRWASAAGQSPAGAAPRRERLAEHARILEASLKHDVEGALLLHERHLARTAEIAIRMAKPGVPDARTES